MPLRSLTAPTTGSLLTSSFLAQVLATAQNADNAVFTGLTRNSVTTGATGTGTTQSSAVALTSQITAFSTVPTGSGALLPSVDSYNASVIGAEVVVINQDPANVLLVYPPVGSSISGTSVNVPYALAAGTAAAFTLLATTLYSVTTSAITPIAAMSLAGNSTSASGPPQSLTPSSDFIVNAGSISLAASVARSAAVHRHFHNVAALSAYVLTSQDVSLVTGAGVSADVQGYYAPNDYGGGTFDLTATGSLVADGFTFFASATTGYGWRRRIPSWGVAPEMAGAYGDYTYASYQSNTYHDDTNAFNALSTYSTAAGGVKIVLTAGKQYYVGSGTWSSGTYIEGPASTFANGSEGSLLATWSNSRIVLSPEETWVFKDNCHVRNVLFWRKGLIEPTPTLAQVRAAVGFNGGSAGGPNGAPTGWLNDNVNNIGSTAVTIADTPQGAKAGASAVLTFAANTWKPGGSGSTGATVYTGWSVSASNGSIPAGAVVESCTTSTLTISLGAINGDCPAGTTITVQQPSIALQFQGNGVCENVAVVGFFTGIQYLGNLQATNCIVDAAGIAYEAVNNGANGSLTNCLACDFWGSSASGSDVYGGAAWRPGVGFMSHNTNGQENTGQCYTNCGAEGYNFSMVWSNCYNNKSWNFGPEGQANNGQPTFGLLTQNDVRCAECHGIYYDGNGIGLGLYHNTITSHLQIHGGFVETGSLTANVVDLGAGSSGLIVGLQTDTGGTGYPYNFDAAIQFWTILSPSCSGGAVPAFNIPSGAYGKICIIQQDFGVVQTSAPGQGVNAVVVLPNLPVTAPAVTGQLYISPNGGLVQTTSTGIGIGQDRRATTTAEGTITLGDLGHAVFVAIGTAAPQEIYLPPLPPLGSPEVLVVDDQGIASPTLPIVVNANGTNTINNYATAQIVDAGGSMRFKAGPTCWRIVR